MPRCFVEQVEPEPQPELDLAQIREWNKIYPPTISQVERLCDEIERLRKDNDYKAGCIAALYHLRDSVPELRRERDDFDALLTIERNNSAALFRVSKDMEVKMTEMQKELAELNRLAVVAGLARASGEVAE